MNLEKIRRHTYSVTLANNCQSACENKSHPTSCWECLYDVVVVDTMLEEIHVSLDLLTPNRLPLCLFSGFHRPT